MNRRRFLAVASTAAFGMGALPSRAWGRRTLLQEGRPPNVLVVVLDTVRGDRFGLSTSLTPAYDRFAARGIRFDDAWAPSSWSLPSHASILTGHAPHRHLADWPGLALAPGMPTLASFLGERGYVAGAFSSNSAWVTPAYLNRGFQRFRAYSIEDHLRRTTLGRVSNRVARKLGAHEAGRGRKAPEVHAQFLDFIEGHPDRPFFAYVCHMDVNQGFHHERLNHPFWESPSGTPAVVAAYDRALTTLDAQVGDLLDELERRGVLDNTVVVVTSDHGESFGPEHAGDHLPTGHGTSLYPEQTHVPLAIVAPDRLPAGLVVSSLAGIGSIPATVCGLLGLEHPFPSPELPTDPGTPVAEGAGSGVVQILHYDDHRGSALVTGRWLFMKDDVVGEERLFDRIADPLCAVDLGSDHPAFGGLRSRLEGAIASGRSSA
jgi:arylsulfatase A-like enzyme